MPLADPRFSSGSAHRLSQHGIRGIAQTQASSEDNQLLEKLVFSQSKIIPEEALERRRELPQALRCKEFVKCMAITSDRSQSRFPSGIVGRTSVMRFYA